MTWLKIDDKMPRNPKIRSLSDGAFRLLITIWADCAENLTDGIISSDAIKLLQNCPGTRKLSKILDELIEQRLLESRGTDWLVVNFLEYNPTREKVLKERGLAKGRMEKSREVAQKTSAKCSPEQSAKFARPVPVPVPDKEEEKISEKNPEEKRFAICDSLDIASAAPPATANAVSEGELGGVVQESLPSAPTEPPTLPLAHEVALPTKTRQRGKKAPATAKPKPAPRPDFRKVVESYYQHFTNARGEKPAFCAMDGKAINALLVSLGSFEECDRIIAAVYADKFWGSKATIQMIARDPSKFKGLKSGPVYNPAKGSPLQQDGATLEMMLGWGFPEDVAKAEAARLKAIQDSAGKQEESK